jgi:gammaproteobacterial enzyme C-terminal transmembrane domain
MLRSKWKRTLLGCSLLTAGGLLPLTAIAAPAAQPQAAQLGKTKSRAATAAQATRVQPPVTQLIVKFKPAADARAAAAGDAYAMTDRRLANISAAAGMSLAYRRPMSGNAHVLKLAQPLSAAEAAALAAKVSQQADVAYAEPDYWMFPAAVPPPADPGYASQWHYHDPATSGYYAGAANLPAAWDITTGSSDVVVAVIDTGVLNHEDLQGNLIGGSAATSGYDMISNASSNGYTANNTPGSADGDGRDADPTDPGDWISASDTYCGAYASNSSWHGTHVAGTIGAVANNGIGGSGVAWQVGLQTVRALGSCGGVTSDIADAIYWAAGEAVPGAPPNPNPAHVINMSLGGKAPCSATPAYQEAIDAAVARGATVVVAAGNEWDWVGNYTPASCNNVITVGALGPDGGEASYSNWDLDPSSYIALSAPGGDQSSYYGSLSSNGVYSTLDGGTTVAENDNEYAFYQGTSMATPHVSGIVALMLAANPKLTDGTVPAAAVPALIKAKLQATVRPFPTGTDGRDDCTTEWCGAGMVDAAGAVAAVSTAPSANAGSDQTVAPGQTANLSGSATDDAHGSIASYAWTQTAGVTATLTGANTATPSFTVPATATTMTFRLRVTDDVGLTANDSVTLTVTPPAPTGLTATANGAAQIDLAWTDASGNETGFKVERRVAGGGAYALVATLPADSVGYSDTGLTASTSYEYQVYAYHDAASSTVATASATTAAATDDGSSSGGGGGGALGWLSLAFLAVPLLRRRKA